MKNTPGSLLPKLLNDNSGEERVRIGLQQLHRNSRSQHDKCQDVLSQLHKECSFESRLSRSDLLKAAQNIKV